MPHQIQMFAPQTYQSLSEHLTTTLCDQYLLHPIHSRMIHNPMALLILFYGACMAQHHTIGDVLVLMLLVVAIFSLNILFYWRLHYIGDCFHPHTIIIIATPILAHWSFNHGDTQSKSNQITRIPIQFPFLCLDPHSIVLNPSGNLWQNPFLSTRSVHNNRERAIPRTTSDDLITYCTTSIRSSNVAWKTDTQSIQCRIPTMHLHWFQWMRFWRTKHSIHSCNEWYVKSPWYSSAFLRSFRMIIIIITWYGLRFPLFYLIPTA
eukprot:563141_1